jgi:glycosyltransferase involved in cell wall biosynthesis
MIKSAHLTGSVSRKAGGLFEAILRLGHAQHRQGMNVKVIGLWDESTEADLKAWSPVAVSAFRQSAPQLIRRPAGYLEELQGFRPDIMHTHGLWLYSSIAARNYNRSNRRSYLVSPHGMLDPWAVKNSAWKKKLALMLFEREHLRRASCLRALCQPEAKAIRDFGLNNPICVVPNGIDLPAEPRPVAAPWRDFLEPGQKILLFLSRIHPKKGLVNLIKAWAQGAQQRNGSHGLNDWVLAIAGWDQGGHEQELKQLCTERQIAFADIRGGTAGKSERASVLFLGPQFNEARSACYQHCAAFVLPSFSEGLPMVVLEAWAYSKPVLMTPECNLPEGFSSDAAVKAEAVEASLVCGLQALGGMSDQDRLAMGGRGHQLVLKKFTWTEAANQLQAVQTWILGGGPKPDCILD